MRNDKDKETPEYSDLMGDILKEYSKDGSMDKLKGQGKPLSEDYFSGDTFQHFQAMAKDAGFKPHWLKLQHEIRDDIAKMAEKYLVNKNSDLDNQLAKINEKIFEYNKSCPPPLQKGLVSLNNIKAAKGRWT